MLCLRISGLKPASLEESDWFRCFVPPCSGTKNCIQGGEASFPQLDMMPENSF